MSLEKRREVKKTKEKDSLDDSSFRRLDFSPIQLEEEVKEKKTKEKDLIEELTEVERDVLEIAKSILKLKRYEAEFEIESISQIQKFPIIEKLYAKCIAKLSYKKGYSKEEIFLAIRSLEEKNWIVTSERRTKLEILTNEKLEKILDFIKNNPGIHARDDKVQKELNITRTPFLKHVMTLERFNLIRSKKIGKSLHYFLSEVPNDYDNLKIIFLNQMIPQILEEIFKDESVSVRKIGEHLDIYSGTILYHINKLKELNLVKSTKNKSDKKIFLVNIELLKVYNDFFKEPDFSKLLQGL
ncbi:MAG: winged helix-turn-helix transcriptional regulator [Candidatus Lokiarchaeota archaeon]|nr:winged helix-turn-helix transcriptional regulator [Candidatus Lokiarchaeota archaeon]